LDEAVASYHKALAIKPDFAEAHNNLGSALRGLGKLDEAVASYHKALAIKPDFAEAHSSLGNAFQDLGQLEDAVASHHKALAIKPDFAGAHNNLGNVLQDLGKLDEAVASYQKALAIKPNFALAHNNLGNVLQGLGQLEDAAASYNKALAIKPDYAEAHYNLHAQLLDPGDMTLSIKCMKRAVDIDPDNTTYRFILGMLFDYSGYPREAATHFDRVENGANADRAKLDAWRHIKSANKKIPPIIGSNIQAFKLGIDAAVNDGLVLEFGVLFGTSIRQIAVLVEQEVHGFDSFEGLPEAWHGEPKGSYSTKGIIPSVQENVVLHQGWFEETLPGFVEKFQAPIRFINIDCDIYSSTKTILDFLAKQIIPGTVIVFDEYIGNENWREDEFKAFQEAVLKYGWKYEYLCFSFMTKQVVVQMN
jgi:tetratricopeptide (TPR) repeat protein